jgi:hypothetical protein
MGQYFAESGKISAGGARTIVASKEKIKARLLIGVCSCKANEHRRAAVRATWLNHLTDGAKAVFFVGEGAGDGKPDVMEVPAPDDYFNLPRKVQTFLQYALASYQFEYVFKCDDDTYVVPERLADLATNGAAFVGSWYFAEQGFASGGAGYLLSVEAARLIADAPRPQAGAEDIWVSSLLRAGGFQLTPSRRLTPDHEDLPRQDNNLITVHYCGPEVMTIVHRAFGCAAPDPDVLATLFARHACWQGPLKLRSDGIFSGGGAAPDGLWEWEAADDLLTLYWFHWPADRLRLRQWGFEAANLRLLFENGVHADQWRHGYTTRPCDFDASRRPRLSLLCE